MTNIKILMFLLVLMLGCNKSSRLNELSVSYVLCKSMYIDLDGHDICYLAPDDDQKANLRTLYSEMSKTTISDLIQNDFIEGTMPLHIWIAFDNKMLEYLYLCTENHIARNCNESSMAGALTVAFMQNSIINNYGIKYLLDKIKYYDENKNIHLLSYFVSLFDRTETIDMIDSKYIMKYLDYMTGNNDFYRRKQINLIDIRDLDMQYIGVKLPSSYVFRTYMKLGGLAKNHLIENLFSPEYELRIVSQICLENMLFVKLSKYGYCWNIDNNILREKRESIVQRINVIR